MQMLATSIRWSQIAKSVQTFTSQIAKSHRNDKTATPYLVLPLCVLQRQVRQKRGVKCLNNSTMTPNSPLDIETKTAPGS